jgi:hypothetical protein
MTTANGGAFRRHEGLSPFIDRSSTESGRDWLSARVTLVNDGQDTEIRLGDGSTIVFKGVTRVEAGFFR